MTTKSIVSAQQAELAKQEASRALTPMQNIGQAIAIMSDIDKEHEFAMRKLGTIHLGVKTTNSFTPVDYFVLPETLRTDEEFREKLESMGENPDKPRRLPIWVMSDRLDVNHVRCRECWGMGKKLKCRATPYRMPDGEVILHCIRLNPATQDYETEECQGDNCPAAKKGDCAWVTKFRFMLPDQKRIGYWEIDTKSQNNKGALARELFDTQVQLHGRIAGVDLVLVMTNERVMHPKITNKQGAVSRIATQPWLLHIEGERSVRKLLADGVKGQAYEADDIEDCYELDEEPIVDEIDFPVGEPPIEADPDTGEVVDAEIVDDELARLRSQCVDMANSLELTPTRIKVLCTMASKPNNKGTIMELTAEECGYFAQLCSDADSKQANLI